MKEPKQDQTYGLSWSDSQIAKTVETVEAVETVETVKTVRQSR